MGLSSSVIENIGLVIIFAGAVIVILLLVLVIRFLKQRFPKCLKLYEVIKKKVFFNLIIRMLIQSYLKLTLATFLALNSATFTTPLAIAEAAVAFLLVLFIFAFPLSSFLFIKKNQDKLEIETFRDKFSSFYSRVKTFQAYAKYQTILYLLRRLILSLTIMYFDSDLVLQLGVTVGFSLGYLCFLFLFQPFMTRLLNFLEIFNEFTILTSLYFCFTFTGYIPLAEDRYTIGWAFSSFVFLNVALNFAFIVFTMLKVLLQTFKAWRKKK
mmetsp:Transcript_19233/g.18374  ORF Transcript_19233/g.18374 Transcript_19233/m.18374 type:complete len:268 (+) Transcript_19233:676-1479(+)